MQVSIYKPDRSVCLILWIGKTLDYRDAVLLLDAFLKKQTSTGDITAEVLHQGKA